MMLRYVTTYLRMLDIDKEDGYDCEGIVVGLHIWYNDESHDRKYHTWSELMIGVRT